MRIEDPEQRPDCEVIEGTGASSSRDGAGNEPTPRPAESSVSVDQRLREQSNDADMGDPTGGDPESRLERKVKQRESGSMFFDGEESDEWVETEEEWLRIHRRPRRDLFSHHDSQGGLELSDISKIRESTVCSTDVGEWRIVGS